MTLDYGEDPGDIMTDLDGIRVSECRVPDGTKTVDGQAFRYCYLSACDGAGYVPVKLFLDVVAENERLRDKLNTT